MQAVHASRLWLWLWLQMQMQMQRATPRHASQQEDMTSQACSLHPWKGHKKGHGFVASVTETAPTRLISGRAGMSPATAYRLASAFSVSLEPGAGAQMHHDLDKAEQPQRPPIARLDHPSPLDT